MQGEQAHRHAGNPVHVEHVDGLDHVLQLQLGAGQDEQVAQRIDAHAGGLAGEGLKDLGHVGHTNVLERNNLDAVPARQRFVDVGQLRRGIALARNSRGHDAKYAIGLADHDRTVHAQDFLERVHGRAFRDGLGGAQGDGSPNARIDDVIFLENVAKDGAHHLAQIGPLEIQGQIAARSVMDDCASQAA